MYRVNPYEEAMAAIEALPYAAAFRYAEALGVLMLLWTGFEVDH